MAWHEWPLILFTVLSQTVVGAFLVLGFVTLKGKLATDEDARLHRNMFFLWALMAVGLLASIMHLGSPLRAFNSLNQVGSSWLSNEILSSSLFFAVGGFYWLLKVTDQGGNALRKTVLIVAMLVGIGFMFAMTKVYLINTVPTWDNLYTPLFFALTVVISGLAFAHTLLVSSHHQHRDLDYILPSFVFIAFVVTIVATVSQMITLSGIHSAVVNASDIIPTMMSLQIMRFVLLFIGFILMFAPRLTASRATLPMTLCGFVFILVSELMNRGIFYGLHMSVGM